MPRGRGGTRQGTPGVAYGNRSDLNVQPVRTAPTEQYGGRVASARAQQAIPLPQKPPVALPAFGRPSERPDEPVQAGLPTGPGPGPDALMSVAPGASPELAVLRQVFNRFPTEDLRRLIERAES